MNPSVHVTFRGLEPSEALETFTRRWADRLDRVDDRIRRCDVAIELPHRHQHQGQRFHVRIAVALPGREVVVSHEPGEDAAHESAYVAVRDAFRAARRQLRHRAA